MGQLNRFGVDVILAIAVAVWFVASGIAKLAVRPAAGRRAVAAAPGWAVVVRRVRGVLEILGGLAVAAGGAISLLGLRIPFPGLALGLVLSGLAAWTVVDDVRTPIRGVRLAVALLGFALVMFFAGFRD
ncbi:MAG TPA: hypothetical protein VGK18_10550 [Propionicimonas sp.]|uniref:hypothetical protein n=1 Tax=Propionicimonas sp. TaxID=1955623 RepID=UPI002F407F6B